MPRKSTTTEAPVETPEPSPEEQVAADAALAAALGLNNQNIVQPPTRRASLGDNFVSVAALISQARKDTRLSEATLLKVWELTLMWALNNRQDHDLNGVFPTEGEGEEAEGDGSLPEPNEIIGGDDDDTAKVTE